MATGSGTRDDPWQLKTPPGTSDYTIYRDEAPIRRRSSAPSAGRSSATTSGRSTTSRRCSAPTATGCRSAAPTSRSRRAEGTVEAWARSPDNPVGGWYGLKKGLRGRFGVYIPPLLEALGLAEVEHNPRNNRMRAT